MHCKEDIIHLNKTMQKRGMTYAAKRTQFKLAFIAFVFVEPFIQFAFVFVESLIQLIVGSLVIFPRPESAFILELEQ